MIDFLSSINIKCVKATVLSGTTVCGVNICTTSSSSSPIVCGTSCVVSPLISGETFCSTTSIISPELQLTSISAKTSETAIAYLTNDGCIVSGTSSGGETNLGTIYTGTSITIISDTGTNATLTGATATSAGIITTGNQLFAGAKCTSIWCATSCVKSPTICGTSCVVGNCVLGTTCVCSAYVCATTALNAQSINSYGNICLYNSCSLILDSDYDGFARIESDNTGSLHSYGACTFILSSAGGNFIFLSGEENIKLDLEYRNSCQTGFAKIGTNIILTTGATRYICFDTASTGTGSVLCIAGNQGAATSAGGSVVIYGGLGGSTSGNGGSTYLAGGSSNGSSGNGGSVVLAGGGSNNGAGGGVSIYGGDGETSSGNVSISGGEIASTTIKAGCVIIAGGYNDEVGGGGDVIIHGGEDISSSNYGCVRILNLPSKTTETCGLYIDGNGILSTGVISGETNLGTTYTTTNITVTSDTGDNAVLTGATATSAGIITTGNQLFAGIKCTSIWCATTCVRTPVLCASTSAVICNDIIFMNGSTSHICFNAVSSADGRDLLINGNQGASTSSGGDICICGGGGGSTSGNGGDIVIAGGRTTAGSCGQIYTQNKLNLASSITSEASLNIPSGTAPTSPVNGDIWATNDGFYSRITGATQTIITKKTVSIASDTTPNPTGDGKENEYFLTALAGNASFQVPSGTAVNGNTLLIRIKDNGSIRALSWNAIYRQLVSLPVSTTASKTIYVGAIYNSADTKWDIVSVVQET